MRDPASLVGLSCGAAAVVLATATAMVSGATGVRGPDVAVWAYGLHRWGEPDRAPEIARLAGLGGRVYLSVEDGSRLLVDDPLDARHLGAVLDLATDRFGLKVEAMLLQDPGWVTDPDGAADRVARVVAFNASRQAAGRPAFAGLHFDIEPHTGEAWQCGVSTERRQTIRALQALFRRLARLVQAGSPPPLPLSVALPWWLGALSAEVAEAAPATWLADLDEVVLMTYGDPGGPLVGGTASAVLSRIDDARLWAGLPPGRGLRVGFALYEYRDPAALHAAVASVISTLVGRPGFRGVALFANDQIFDAPLVTMLEGRVVDPSGQPVAGAEVRSGSETTRTNRCGLFGLQRLLPSADVGVTAPGYRSRRVSVGPLVPGRVLELPPLVVEPEP